MMSAIPRSVMSGPEDLTNPANLGPTQGTGYTAPMTPFDLKTLHDLAKLEHDSIIDVRSPAEFAEDHMPGAINLPVLNDAERAQVGTIYKQDSPFSARKIGGALVAHNTATHLQTVLAEKPGSWRPLVYCWRGGQRSTAFATILDQVGWRVDLLAGGYQRYRRHVVRALYEDPLPHRIVLVEGGTGTAKTALLHELERLGAQILDLEGLAGHRGSLFGGLGPHQPSQKMFESHLVGRMISVDPNTVTFVEAESSKIGERLIPPSLWTVMTKAQRVRLDAPLAARGDYLARAYADLTTDSARLHGLLDQLRPYHAASQIESWQLLAQDGNWRDLAQGLISEHYDPRYAKSARLRPAPEFQVALRDLTEDSLAQAAAQVLEKVK